MGHQEPQKNPPDDAVLNQEPGSAAPEQAGPSATDAEKEREERGNTGPDELPSFGQGA